MKKTVSDYIASFIVCVLLCVSVGAFVSAPALADEKEKEKPKPVRVSAEALQSISKLQEQLATATKDEDAAKAQYESAARLLEETAAKRNFDATLSAYQTRQAIKYYLTAEIERLRLKALMEQGITDPNATLDTVPKE
jgi:hypothetical protein